MLWVPPVATALNVGARYLGHALSRPKRPRSNLEALMQEQRASTMRDVNAANAAIGTQLGPRLSAQGMQGSSYGTSLLGSLAGQNVRGALSDLSRQRMGLMQQREEEERAYEAEKRSRLAELLSGIGEDIGGGLGVYGALWQEKKNFNDYLALLKRLYGQPRYGQTAILPSTFHRGGYNPYGLGPAPTMG